MRRLMNLTFGAVLVAGLGLVGASAEAQQGQTDKGMMQQQSQQQQSQPETMQPQSQQRKMEASERQQATKREAQIADVISNRLARSGSLAGTQIVVTVDNSTATLKGEVGSQQEKERAAQIARSTSGIRTVDNQLDVNTAGVRDRRGVEISDEALAQKVAEKLKNEVFTLAKVEENWLYGWQVEGTYWGFDVDVDNGRVTLEGEVPMYQDITSAVQVARGVPGVRAVDAEDLEPEDWNGYWDYDPYFYYPYYDSYDYDYGYYDDFDYGWEYDLR